MEEGLRLKKKGKKGREAGDGWTDGDRHTGVGKKSPVCVCVCVCVCECVFSPSLCMGVSPVTVSCCKADKSIKCGGKRKH